MDLGFLIAIWACCGLIGAAVGDLKGRGAAGFWLGLLLGPIGIIIAACLSRTPEDEAKYREAVAQSPTQRAASMLLSRCLHLVPIISLPL